MTYSTICFPHLHIVLKHVGQSLHIGNFEIALYGVVVAAAMVTGIYFAMWLARKTGQNPDRYFNFAVLAIILSVLGARAYYVIFSWDYYSLHPLEIWDIRGGGLAIYGGVLTGVLCAAVFARKHGMRLLLLLDTAMPALALGQTIGRWGNFFNREAFGEYTNGLFAMALPVERLAAADVTERMLNHAYRVDGILFVQVHPTFLYESMWNLALVALMLYVTLRLPRKHFEGQIFFIYLMGYGVGRFWIEGLRTDQLLWPGTGVAVSQVLSVLIAVVGLVLYIWGRRRGDYGSQ